MAEISGEITPRKSINGTVEQAKTVYENDYELLKNLPKIEGILLIGDISLADLGLAFDGVTIIKDSGVLRVRSNSHGHVIDNIAGLRGLIEDKAEASALVTLENDLETHRADFDNPHNVTAEQVGLGNVENKSSAEIRGELTKEDVTAALGYTPPADAVTEQTAAGKIRRHTSTADHFNMI